MVHSSLFDTSSLIKAYIEEEGSKRVKSIISSAEGIRFQYHKSGAYIYGQKAFSGKVDNRNRI